MNISKIIEKIQTADLIECDEISEYYAGPYDGVVELEDKYYAVKWEFKSDAKTPLVDLLEYKEVVPIKVMRTEYVIPKRHQEILCAAGKIEQFFLIEDHYLLNEKEFRQNLFTNLGLKDGN